MRIMAVDYGDARTGIAVCDTAQILASPLCVIHERDANRLIQKIAETVKENEIGEIVVGNPINMNGSRGERSEKCIAFSEELKKAVNVPVFLFDERQTTITANQIMNEVNRRGKKRKETIDAVAAAVILESYLAYKANQKYKDI